MQPQYLSFSKPGTKLPSSTEFNWLQAITEKNFLVVMTDQVNGQIDNPRAQWEMSQQVKAPKIKIGLVQLGTKIYQRFI